MPALRARGANCGGWAGKGGEEGERNVTECRAVTTVSTEKAVATIGTIRQTRQEQKMAFPQRVGDWPPSCTMPCKLMEFRVGPRGGDGLCGRKKILPEGGSRDQGVAKLACCEGAQS